MHCWENSAAFLHSSVTDLATVHCLTSCSVNVRSIGSRTKGCEPLFPYLNLKQSTFVFTAGGFTKRFHSEGV